MNGKIIDYPDGNRWVICPYCGKKQIKVTEDTVIVDMPWKCKGSNCRKEFTINVTG